MAKLQRAKQPSALVAVVFVAILVGLTATIAIVSTEGFDGLWRRKKDFIEKSDPAMGKAVDEAEKALVGARK